MVRRSADEQAARLREAEDRAHQGRARLGDAEAAATVARRQLADKEASVESNQRRCVELRLEADAAEKELIKQMGRKAQLEGQVGEGRIQIRETEARIGELLAQVRLSQSTHKDLECTVTGLRTQLTQHELEHDRVQGDGSSVEDRLQRAREEVQQCRQQTVKVMDQCREGEESRSRRATEMYSTRRVVDSVLKAATGETAHYRDTCSRLKQDATADEDELEARGRAVEEAQRRTK